MSVLVEYLRRIGARWRSSTLIPNRSVGAGLHGRMLQLTCFFLAVSSCLPCSASVVPDAPRTSTTADLGDSYWHTENYYSQISSGLTTEEPVEESVWEDNEGYGYFSVGKPGGDGARHPASAGVAQESAQTEDEEEAQDIKVRITASPSTRLWQPPTLGRKMSFGDSASKTRQRLLALLIALAISGVFVLRRRQRSAPSKERAEAIAMRVGGRVPSVLAVGALLVLSGVLMLLREGIDEQAWDKLPVSWRPEPKAAGPSPEQIFAVKSMAAVAVLASVLFTMMVVISGRRRANAALDSYPGGKSTQVQTEARDGTKAEKAGGAGESERESVDRTATDEEESKGAGVEKGGDGAAPAGKGGGTGVRTREAEREGQKSSPPVEPKPLGGSASAGNAEAATLMSPAPQATSTGGQPAEGLTGRSAHSSVSHSEGNRSGAPKTASATASSESTTRPRESPEPAASAVPERKSSRTGIFGSIFRRKS